MTEMHDRSHLANWRAESETLWMVTAIFQPFKLDAVTLALEGLPDCHGATLTECRGFGSEKLLRDRAHRDAHKGEPPGRHGLVGDYSPKLRIECASASEASAVAIARAIAEAAHTGREGDGKVFVAPVTGAIAIRSFAVDDHAL